MIICDLCGCACKYYSRNMCRKCYRREMHAANLPGHRTVYKRREDVIQDVAELAQVGATKERVVSALGMSWDAIMTAHRRSGVPMPKLYLNSWSRSGNKP